MRSNPSKLRRELPLYFVTPDSWAFSALSQPLLLLNDHAHLEKKAASNALDLLPLWPEPDAPPRWVSVMSGVARDEVQHLATVVRILEKRGGAMSKWHKNLYARQLRELVRRGTGPLELGDRLLVSALIEARSCERFEILSRHAPDAELRKLYHSLWSSEHGHYRVFHALAEAVLGKRACTSRWEYMLRAEAKIIESQEPGSGMHTGVAPQGESEIMRSYP